MGDDTSIEWTDATWNPIVGCSVVSPGCTNCYAMAMARRIALMTRAREGNDGHYAGLTQPTKAGAVWTGKVAQAPDHILTKPLRWKRPRRIFVNSMSDLFHESVPDEWIDRVFAVMALCPQHTFQVLTKRSRRMREYLSARRTHEQPLESARMLTQGMEDRLRDRPIFYPLPNVHLGISAEDQPRFDERVLDLLYTSAAVRFVSAEPLLGPIDFAPKADDIYQRLSEWYGPTGFDPTGSQPRRARRGGWFPRLDWVIVGGESGPGARPMHPDWARDIRDQCVAAKVPFFFKQHGEWISVPDLRNLRGGQGPGFGIFDHCAFDQNAEAVRVGKRAAGRLLDGVEHNAMPETRA